MTQPPQYPQPYPQPQYGQGPQQQPYPPQNHQQGYHQDHQQPYQQQQPYGQQPYQQPGQYAQPYGQQAYQRQAPQQQYPAAPQGYQQQYQAPAQAPQGYQRPAAHQGQGPACRICGNGPAAPATFRAVVGAVFMHTIWTTQGPFCRDCGLHTFRGQTAKSLTGGWCSVGAIILTPVFVLMNLSARGKVADLPAPRPRPDGQGHAPLDPGAPLTSRPGAYVYPFLVLCLLVAIIASNLAR